MNIFQKFQDRALRKETERALAAIKRQWQQQLRRHGDVGVECDAVYLSGRMAFPRRRASQMSALCAEVRRCLADEGIPLIVMAEDGMTAITWRHTPVGIRQ